jgi:hypothetical protein
MAVAAACAQPGFPPGGPPDPDPPLLTRIRPDTNAVNVRARSVSFQFDEVVTERPQGSQGGLAGVFLISPSDGEPSVSWRRTRVDVRPRGGFRPNTTYTIRLLPGMTDLDGNVDSSGAEIVFSTGPTIDSGSISGTVFDWPGNKSAPRALIEAIQLPDSTRFVTTADSLGFYTIGHLPSGRFLLRGVIDQNRNRGLDSRELFDSVTVELRDTLRRELYAFVHDTLGPGIAQLEVRDSVTLRVGFDHPLDTALQVTPANFTLKAADSSVIAIASVITERELEKRAADSARVKAIEDSVRNAARADSIRRADSARVNTRITRPGGRRPRADTTAVARDTTPKVEPPTPTIAIPSDEVIITLEEPLPPAASFKLRVEKLRSLLGYERESERNFRTPRPTVDSTLADSAALRDSAAVRPDSARRDTTQRDTTARDPVRRDTVGRDTVRRDTTDTLRRRGGRASSDAVDRAVALLALRRGDPARGASRPRGAR